MGSLILTMQRKATAQGHTSFTLSAAPVTNQLQTATRMFTHVQAFVYNQGISIMTTWLQCWPNLQRTKGDPLSQSR